MKPASGFPLPPGMLDTIIATQGSYFSTTSKLSPQKIAADLVNPVKAMHQGELLGRFTTLASQRVLEIGSGYGMNLLVWAKQFTMDVYGIEPDSLGFGNSCRLAADLFRYNNLDASRIISAAGERIPFKNDTFDIVYSSNVLEHVNTPFATLHEALRVLKPGGVLQFIFPNFHSFFDGHYAVFHPPVLVPRFFSWYIRTIIRRDPAFAKTLHTELTVCWTIQTTDRLRQNFSFDLVTLGDAIFRERMTTADFDTWAGLGKVRDIVLFAKKMRLDRFMAWLMIKSRTWTPVILTLRKKHR